jgi:hypothetical protein
VGSQVGVFERQVALFAVKAVSYVEASAVPDLLLTLHREFRRAKRTIHTESSLNLIRLDELLVWSGRRR